MQRSALLVEVDLGQRERFLDAQASAPQHDDQTANPSAMDAGPGLAHDRNDLLSRRRIGRVTDPLVARRAPRKIPGQGDRRATAAGGIQQRRGHEASSR
jgi:hypothetical protein